ncbi:Vacuolar protein sorting/targeting protein 10, partial [Bienertia sinuspersici]
MLGNLSQFTGASSIMRYQGRLLLILIYNLRRILSFHYWMILLNSGKF